MLDIVRKIIRKDGAVWLYTVDGTVFYLPHEWVTPGNPDPSYCVWIIPGVRT